MQKHQLTLRQVRNNCGYSIEQASELTGIPAREIRRCERNAGKAEVFRILKLCALYGIDVSHIDLKEAPVSVDIEHFLRSIAANTPENNRIIDDFLRELELCFQVASKHTPLVG